MELMPAIYWLETLFNFKLEIASKQIAYSYKDKELLLMSQRLLEKLHKSGKLLQLIMSQGNTLHLFLLIHASCKATELW